MAITENKTNGYVKFIRGSEDAFKQIVTKDSNTLYFVTNSENPNVGSLYLGSVLIGGGSGAEGVSLGDLTNVIEATAEDNQSLLYYDAEQESWVPKTLEEIISEVAGEENADKVLKGDGTWVSVPSIELNPLNFTNNADAKLTLVGFEDAAVGSIAVKGEDGKLSWSSKADLLNEINAVSRETIDSLEDLESLVEAGEADTNTIYLVKNENGNEGNLYEEYMVVGDSIERIGSGAVGDLSDYLTKTAFETSVGDLSKLILSQENGSTLVDQVNDLTERLTWYTIDVSTEEGN